MHSQIELANQLSSKAVNRISDVPVVLPIYLDQPASGCFLPLIDFIDSGEVQGIGSPPDPKSLQGRHQGDKMAELDAKLSVGLFGMGGIDGSVDWTTVSQEWSQFGTQSSSGQGRVGYNINWGFGYRLHTQSSTSDYSANVDEKALALKTKVDSLQTSFAMELFGMRYVKLYQSLPTPDGYDANTLAAFELAVLGGIESVIENNLATPVPIGVEFGGDYATLAAQKSMAIMLAAQMILNGKSQDDAVAQAGAAQLPASEIARVYQAWGVNEDKGMGIAAKWLHVDGWFLNSASKQSEIQNMISGPPLSTASIAGATSALSAQRMIVRSQIMDIQTAFSLGYGGASAGFTGDIRRLVYEVYTRTGPIEQIVENGIAKITSKISGLISVNCISANIDSKFSGSYSGIAADAAVNAKAADFSFNGCGYTDAVSEYQLKQESQGKDAANYLVVVGGMLQLLGDEKNHVPTQLPAGMSLQSGIEQDPRGFPGARAIVRAFTSLANDDSITDARAALAKIGLDPACADAAYAVFQKQDAQSYLKKALIS